MGMCKSCNEVFPANDMVDGICPNCREDGVGKEQVGDGGIFGVTNATIPWYKTKESKENIEGAKAISISTETVAPSNSQSVGIVTTQRVYGINIVKDLFSGVRDIVGGRINSLEEPLIDAKKEIIGDLKIQAFKMGATNIIGLSIEHSYNNGGGGSILSVSATATAIKKSEDNDSHLIGAMGANQKRII